MASLDKSNYAHLISLNPQVLLYYYIKRNKKDFSEILAIGVILNNLYVLFTHNTLILCFVLVHLWSALHIVSLSSGHID